MYQVIDCQTGAVVGTYKTAIKARATRDKKDSQYGACRYVVKPVKFQIHT